MIYAKYREPNWSYGIRQITSNNKTGDAFAITIPRIIAQQYSGVKFNMFMGENMMIFSSGCKHE